MPGTSENTADKWHPQREKQRKFGENVDENRNGEIINDEDDE